MTARTIGLGLAALLLTVACAPQPPADTPEDRARIAGELARLSVELGSLDEALDSGAELAWESSGESLELELGRALTEDEGMKVRGILRGVLADFVTAPLWEESVTRVYAEHFTAAELQASLDFYSSPAGRRVLELEGELIAQVDEEIEGVLGDRMEEFVDRVDQELAVAFDGLGGGS